MQITDLKHEDLAFEAKIAIPFSKIDNKVQEKLANLSKNAKIDGFRAGKVPINIVKKTYQKEVRENIVSHEIDHAIQDIIKDRKLKIVEQPSVRLLVDEENKGVEFIVEFELLPDIKLPDLTTIKIIKPKLIIEKDNVDQQIDRLLYKIKLYNQKHTDPIENDHKVIVDAVAYVNDEMLKNGEFIGYDLIIGNKNMSFLDGFDDQLIGHKIGDKVEVHVTLPQNPFWTKGSGQLAKFIVQIKEVYSSNDVVVDDEFAKQFNCETLEELRNKLAKNIEVRFEEPIYTSMKMNLFDQLERLLTFNVPKSLLSQEVIDLKSQAKEANDSDEMFENKSEEEINEYYNKIALRRVKIGLMLSEYAKIKDLQINNTELANALINYAKRFKGQEKEVVNFYNKNPRVLANFSGSLLETKVVQYILDHEVILEEKDYNLEKLKEFLAQEEDRAIY